MHKLHVFSLPTATYVASQYLRRCPVYEVMKQETLWSCTCAREHSTVWSVMVLNYKAHTIAEESGCLLPYSSDMYSIIL